ncbi:MAG: NUDIX domain-containing protein [Actinomycetota bacterium]|nr:NUDIX domain-containing protein [Actinomycetota bacterium]
MTQPRVGVGCVVRKRSELLLVRRRGAHGEGTWSSPGGNLDFVEEPAACAARESEEETGVEADTPRFVGLTTDVFASENKHDLTLWFEAEHVQGEPHVRSPDELSAAGWFREDELPDPLFLQLRNLLGGRRIV